jgi:hypothetical protein
LSPSMVTSGHAARAVARNDSHAACTASGEVAARPLALASLWT